MVYPTKCNLFKIISRPLGTEHPAQTRGPRKSIKQKNRGTKRGREMKREEQWRILTKWMQLDWSRDVSGPDASACARKDSSDDPPMMANQGRCVRIARSAMNGKSRRSALLSVVPSPLPDRRLPIDSRERSVDRSASGPTCRSTHSKLPPIKKSSNSPPSTSIPIGYFQMLFWAQNLENTFIIIVSHKRERSKEGLFFIAKPVGCWHIIWQRK